MIREELPRMGKRYLITVGEANCDGFGCDSLPRAASDVARIGAFFSQHHQAYQWCLRSELANNPTANEIRESLGNWSSAAERSADDCLVIYWAGHGMPDPYHGDHLLLTSDSRPGAAHSYLRTQDLVTLVCSSAQFPRSILVILDVCTAAHGGGQVVAELDPLRRHFDRGAGVWILSSADAVSAAYDGAFVSAFLAVTEDISWAPRGGAEFISPADIAVGINGHFSKIRLDQCVLSHSAFTGRSPPPFIRNPNFDGREGERTLEDEDYWRLKASGADEVGYPGWFFSGRHRVLENLVTLIGAQDPERRTRVVTGAPGSGKSAVLGLLSTAADPFGTPMVRDAAIRSLGARIELPVISIQARGLLALGLLDALGARLGLADASMSAIQAALSASKQPVIVLVDSLDESSEPEKIEGSVLRPLSAHENIRLIVATRKIGDRVPLGDVADVLDLDSKAFFDAADIAGYAFARITSTVLGAPYSKPDHHPLAQKLSARIAASANHSFLYARIVSRWLMAEPATIGAALPALPATLSLAFTADLERFGVQDREKVLDLLLPLAYSLGRGLPHKNIWAAAATRMSGRRYDSADIGWLIRNAGYFLILDIERGETVYRLYHESFAEHLRSGRDRKIDNRAMALGLADALVGTHGSGSPWVSASEPYTITRFASHASAGDILLPYLRDPEFLLAVSPESLTPELLGNAAARELPEVRIYRRAAAKIRSSDRATAAAHLALSALQEGAVGFAEQLRHYRRQAAWWPTWCNWKSEMGGFSLARTHESVTAMLPFTDPDGASWAICGHLDGSVSLWKVPTGECVFRQYMPANPGRIESLALAPLPAGTHIIAAAENQIFVVDFAGQVLAGLELKDIQAIVFCETHQAVAVSLGRFTRNAKLVLLSLPSLSEIARRENAAASSIYALAVIDFRGTPALASGSDSVESGETTERETLRVWSLPELNLAYASSDSDVKNVKHLAEVRIGERTYLAISPIFGFGLTLWDYERDTFHRICGSDYNENIDRVIDADERGGQTVLLCVLSHKLLKVRLRIDRESGDVRRDGPVVHLPDLFKSLVFSKTFGVRGRSTLLAANITELYLLDLAETLAADRLATADRPLRSHAIGTIAAHGANLLLASLDGDVLLCSKDGEVYWHRMLGEWMVAAHFFRGPDARIFLVGKSGDSICISEATGEAVSPAVKLGTDATCATGVDWDGKSVVAVAIDSEPTGTTDSWAVRLWDPLTSAEVDTTYQRFGESNWRFPSCNPTKRLQALNVFKSGGQMIMSFAGPHGEVRYADLRHPDEDTGAWDPGGESEYLSALCSVDIGGEVIMFAGGDWGKLYARNLTTDTPFWKKPIELQQGTINALVEARDKASGALVAGSNGGFITVISFRGDELFKIDLENAVYSLTMLPGLQLIAGTQRGVVSILLNAALVSSDFSPAEFARRE